jgi:transcriptional regulator NrdR family protein
MVVKTTKEDDSVLRSRKCLVCGHNWFTQELVVRARVASRIEVTADV